MNFVFRTPTTPQTHKLSCNPQQQEIDTAVLNMLLNIKTDLKKNKQQTKHVLSLDSQTLLFCFDCSFLTCVVLGVLYIQINKILESFFSTRYPTLSILFEILEKYSKNTRKILEKYSSTKNSVL